MLIEVYLPEGKSLEFTSGNFDASLLAQSQRGNLDTFDQLVLRYERQIGFSSSSDRACKDRRRITCHRTGNIVRSLIAAVGSHYPLCDLVIQAKHSLLMREWKFYGGETVCKSRNDSTSQ